MVTIVIEQLTFSEVWSEWFAENQHYEKTLWINKKARRRGFSGKLKGRHIKRMVRDFRGCCAYCGQPLHPTLRHADIQFTIDHFYPLVHGGTNSYTNVLPSCNRCNNDKGESDPLEWLCSRFGEARTRRIIERIYPFLFGYQLGYNPDRAAPAVHYRCIAPNYTTALDHPYELRSEQA
jgi:hypothetical protein